MPMEPAATGVDGTGFARVCVLRAGRARLALSGAQMVRNERGTSDLSIPWPAGVTTRRAFRHDEAVSAVVRVSQIGAKLPGVVTVSTIIQDRDGAEVSRETRELPVELFATNRIVEHRAGLPLSRLQPGEYLLTFEAKSGDQMERSLLRFTVDGL